ncbi:hypothetical protein B296_00048814 [Ensete ventricosum]|uniref:Uncharacterized protein n=1 Tax=Ensete ventricosum TaxID=4639 RepID=A0A426X7W1_ENSVE|nr:hypothetical protein B296_00048814 [Ensete ventricosum]
MGAALQVVVPVGAALQATASTGDFPCKGPWLQLAATTGGLAVAPFLFPRSLRCENAARTRRIREGGE